MYQYGVIPNLSIFEFILIEKKVIPIPLKLPIEDFVFSMFNNLVIQPLANNCNTLKNLIIIIRITFFNDGSQNPQW